MNKLSLKINLEIGFSLLCTLHFPKVSCRLFHVAYSGFPSCQVGTAWITFIPGHGQKQMAWPSLYSRTGGIDCTPWWEEPHSHIVKNENRDLGLIVVILQIMSFCKQFVKRVSPLFSSSFFSSSSFVFLFFLFLLLSFASSISF